MPIEAQNQTMLDAFKDATNYEGDGHSRLILGELANATEFDDPDALVGLNTYLHVNGYADELDSAVVAGGLFPEKPEWYGTRNADRMRAIGQDPDIEYDGEMNTLSRISYDVGESEDAEWLREHHDEWIAKQMNTWNDIKSYTERRLDDLFAGLDLEQIDYCMGEEEFDFNRKEKEKKKLKKFIRKFKEYQEDLEAEKSKLKDRIPQLRERFEEDIQSYETLMRIHNRVSSHLQATNPDVEQFYDDILEEEEDELLSGLSERRKDEFRSLFDDINADEYDSAKEQKDAYLAVVDEHKDEWEEVKALEDMIARKDEIDDKLSKLDVEGEDPNVTRFTKQYAIEPEDAGALYMLVKRDLTNNVFEVIPDQYEDALDTHISRYATVEDIDFEATYENEDGKTVEVSDTLEEAEYEVFGDTMVIHNTKFRSNTPTIHAMEEAVQEVVYRNMLEDVRKDGQDMPSTVIVPHGAGGFATQRVNLTPEGRRQNQYRDDPEMVTVMTLPTFQSTDNLLDFKDRGLRNINTKRIDKHLHDSGAIIQTVLDDGSEFNEFVHHTSLSILGEMTRKLWMADPESETYEETKEQIEEMCARPMHVRAPLADVHFGAANFENTPSNYERAQRTLNYLTDVYGEAVDELVFSEMVEGVMDHTEMTKQVMGDLPNVLRDSLAEQASELDYDEYDSPMDYMEDVIDYGFDEMAAEMTKNMEQLPYGNESKQYDAAKQLIDDAVAELKPELVALVTGNHPRNDSGGDEAQDTARWVDMDDENLRVADAAGGTKHGGFGSWVDETTGRVITYQHKPPKGGKHLAKNIPRGIKEANLEGDEFVFNHFHTPIAGVFMGKSWMVNPAEKGGDAYATVSGYGSPVYGALIQYSNNAEPESEASDLTWYAFHHVNDDTLEQEEHTGDALDDAHEQIKAGFKQAMEDIYEDAVQEAGGAAAA